MKADLKITQRLRYDNAGCKFGSFTDVQRLQSLVREQLKRSGALEAEREATQPQASARGFGNSSYPRLGRSQCGAAINFGSRRTGALSRTYMPGARASVSRNYELALSSFR